jgi:hypothetical protein
MKTRILLLITLCLFSFCGREKDLAEGEIADCSDCVCPDWIRDAKLPNTDSPLFDAIDLHCIKINGDPYYAVYYHYSSVMGPNLYYADGTEIKSDHQDYKTLMTFFNEKKFCQITTCD